MVKVVESGEELGVWKKVDGGEDVGGAGGMIGVNRLAPEDCGMAGDVVSCT